LKCDLTNYLPKKLKTMNNKFITGLIVGAVAGAALALFLSSDKGEEIIDNIKDAAGDAADTAKEHFGNVKDELGKLLKKSKHFVEDLETKVKDATS